jgi:uncharacterized cupredoxin-like copper-binding protein
MNMSGKVRFFWTVVILAPLCILLSQYASRIQVAQPRAAASGADLKFTASDFKFDPNSATVKAGSPVKVTVANKGAVDHTWVLLDKDGKTELTKLEIKIGQTASKDFTAPAAGSYTFICDVPGHKESGMTGTFTVQ